MRRGQAAGTDTSEPSGQGGIFPRLPRVQRWLGPQLQPGRLQPCREGGAPTFSWLPPAPWSVALPWAQLHLRDPLCLQSPPTPMPDCTALLLVGNLAQPHCSSSQGGMPGQPCTNQPPHAPGVGPVAPAAPSARCLRVPGMQWGVRLKLWWRLWF